MGIFSDYINKRLTFDQISEERKKQLKKISEIRKRDILVYASDPTKNGPTLIHPPDLLPFKDQLSYVKTNEADIILETPEVLPKLLKIWLNICVQSTTG